MGRLTDKIPDCLHAGGATSRDAALINNTEGLNTSTHMRTKRRFSREILAVLRQGKGLRLRAGTGPHRFIGIWVVVVKNRVFVRSWSVKPDGWYRTLLKEPCGAIRIDDHEMAIRAARVVNESLRDAVDRAYLDKYNSPGALKYAKDLGSTKSRATTMELIPAL